MSWENKRVLVTGAGGFIGSHLTERLINLGAKTKALIHYNSFGRCGWLDYLPKNISAELEVVSGDICDKEIVARTMREVDVVFHLAALIAIPYSYHAPLSYIKTNVEGTYNVLSSARELGGGIKIIHTSTSEVYGTACYVPIDEKHPLQAQSPYSASKIGADKIAESFFLSFGLPVTIVRPFNTFGPRQSARAIVPTIITQCLSSDKIHLGSLHPTRDLNYISNTVDGFLMAALSEKTIGKTVNLGSGQEISVGDLAIKIGQLMNKKILVECEKVRVRPGKSEVERLLADNVLARELLNWEPRVGLEQGLKHTIDWIKINYSKYKSGVYAV